MDECNGIAAHCEVGMHGECYPALGTAAECGCSCHDKNRKPPVTPTENGDNTHE